MALVIAVQKSADGLVRSATLRSVALRLPSSDASRPARQITRPISKLILLVPGNNDEGDDNSSLRPGSVTTGVRYSQT